MSVHRTGALGTLVTALLVLGTLSAAPAAWAAAPGNDNRADAVLLQTPDKATGTLVEATLEATNDDSQCAATDSSVWYHFTMPARGAIVLELDANGKMDATVDLFQQVRSKLTWIDCRATDSNGLATLDHDGLQAGGDYAIRVGNQTGSTADTFTLKVLVPTAPPSPPGRHLPHKGIRNQVDRILNPGDTYWKKMVAGRTMRLSLRTTHCTWLEVYPPGTTSFDVVPVRSLSCGGYGLFTPTTTGRHYLVVRAARDRDVQRYHLRVAPARRDDTVPGILIHNHDTVTGTVNGGIDSRDLYRFDVTHRSALTLRLSGGPTMNLLKADGVSLGEAANEIGGHLGVGRYYVAVSGTGKYSLRLALKTITHARLLVNGRHRATIEPSAKARLWLRVRPAVNGPAQIIVERLDPVEGWQFLRKYRPAVSDGSARVPFTPPSVGRYRAYASYLGTRQAAPSASGIVRLRVQRPLGS
jgi:hypothetical protein